MTAPGARTVDSHQHFWQISRFRYDWMQSDQKVLFRDFLPTHLKPRLDAAGIQQSIIVQAHQSVEETRWLLELAEQHDWIAGVVGWVDLTSTEVGDTLEELCQNSKLKGIRHPVHDEQDGRWLLRPDVLSGLRELARRGLPYDLLLRPWHLACIEALAERCPNLELVIDHIAKPMIQQGIWEPWATDVAAARIPGLHCKLSGMVTEANHAAWKTTDLAPYVRHVLEHFGEDRIMFGSDWPVCLLAAGYSQVVAAAKHCLQEAGVSAAGLSKVLGGNAIRFYGLD